MPPCQCRLECKHDKPWKDSPIGSIKHYCFCLSAEKRVPHDLFTPLLIGSISAAGILCLILIMLFYKYMQVIKHCTFPACPTLFDYIYKQVNRKTREMPRVINAWIVFWYLRVLLFTLETQISDSVESYRKRLCGHWPHPATVRWPVGVSAKQLALWWASRTYLPKSVLCSVSRLP